jgi:hypothetical protein
MSNMVIKTLIVRKTLGCRSSGISLMIHKLFVKLLIVYKIKNANGKYNNIILEIPLISTTKSLIYDKNDNLIYKSRRRFTTI